ncbi:MAG TPA: matrixin family metalloprotease, partial [Candidatus Solibacter sp.]
GMGGPSSVGTTITHGIVILSNNTSKGAGPSYLENFFTTAVHEVGHALGLQHTWTGSAMSQDVLRNTSRARPFDADDVAAINTLYGPAGWQNNFGSISGTVRFTTGNGVSLASVVAVSPSGAAVSSLTNPDGTYRIDGIPAGNFLLYVHPLPPDAIPADGTGLKLPQDPSGNQIGPSGAFGTVFYPNTTDPRQAANLSIARGSVITNQNFTVQPRNSVPAYDLITASYIDMATRTSLWDFTGKQWAKVFPAYVNNTQAGMFFEVRANSGDAPVPQSATVLGTFGTASGDFGTASGDYLRIYNDPAGKALWLYFAMPIFAGTGPRHLVLNYGNDIFVLPQAVNLVQKPVPAVASVSPNSDGSVTVAGSSFGADSRVFFDGVQAGISRPFSGGDAQGSITVMPPPGNGGQTPVISVFNGDSQNTNLLPHSPVTYTYPGNGTPQINHISVPSLTAGATSLVDITTSNANFVDGQVTLGFGSDDITVQRVWVLGPNHLQANITVADNAALGSSEISLISGFEVMNQANAFQVLAKNPSLPVVTAVINGNTAQPTIYPGSIVSIYGVNLAASPAGVQVTLNDQPVTLQPGGVLPTQINFFLPANFPTGPATLKVNNGSLAANPIAVQIDVAPPTIQSATNASGVPYDALHFAMVLDVVNVYVSNLDPGVLTNPGRVAVMLNGQSMPVQSIAPAANGQVQIQFVLNQSFGGAPVNLEVLVDGSSSAPAIITVR